MNMVMRNIGSALAALLLAGITSSTVAAEYPTLKSAERGVTVAVTPQNLSDAAASWEFRIVLDTHSGDLSDDLTRTAALFDGGGKRYAPVAWEGGGPGGHHREGVLRFQPISPRPASIEMRIARDGEAVLRVFRWQLKP
jgi:hypothetical protein